MVNIQYMMRLLIIAIAILIGNQNARESDWSEKDAWKLLWHPGFYFVDNLDQS